MILNDEDKRVVMEEIKRFFFEERDEEIGEIAAMNFLDFVTEKIGPYYYNAAIREAVKQTENNAMRLEEDLYSLLRNTKRK